MNKYLALFAVGSANACHMMEDMPPLFGLLQQGRYCPASDAPKLNHMQANRVFLKNAYAGFIKGWYAENEHVVSDDCFGHWMEPTFNSVWGLSTKVHEDFWSVGVDEVKEAAGSLIDLYYKNAEVCHFKRVQDDAKNWCLENPGQCIFMENMEERLFDNLFDILGELFDLYKETTRDDTCYSDLEVMAQFRRIFNDVGEISSSVSGFDYKWDQSIERKHIKHKAFHTQIKDAIKNYQNNGADPLALAFPDVAIFLKELEQAIDQFFNDITAMGNKFVDWAKPKHHLRAHHIRHEPSHHQEERKMDPFSAFFKPHKPHHNMPEYDPFPAMMEFMKPTGPPKSVMH